MKIDKTQMENEIKNDIKILTLALQIWCDQMFEMVKRQSLF